MKALPYLAFVILTALFEFFARSGIIPTYILPAPSDVFQSLRDSTPEYLEALKLTAFAAIMGWLSAIVIGVSLSVFFSLSKFLEAAFYPYTVLFQTVPLVAIAPLLVIWFGFGLPTVIMSALIVSVFPVMANTSAGIRSTPDSLLDLFRLYRANRFQTLIHLQLPYAIPQILAGVRISSGLALIGAIVGEFIAGGGLGGLIDIARTQQRLDKVFASVLLASILGLLFVGTLNRVSRLIFSRWKF